MYAVICIDGGRQYRIEEGQELLVDFRRDPESGDPLETGRMVQFERILAFGDTTGVTFGTPTIDGAIVEAEVLGHKRGKKIIVQKFNRRKNYRRKKGHRQNYTRIKISKISLPA